MGVIKDKGVNELIEAIENIHRKNRKINFNLVGNFDVNNPRSIDRNKILKMQKKSFKI